MDRHAYLITAYNNFKILDRLIRLLDDDRNDIYVHVDKKASNFDPAAFSNLCRHSRLTFIPRMKVYWGEYSQIESILRLFQAALPRHYSYYHLLSGVDLPIKSQNYIHEFCANNRGKEFVGFAHSFDMDWVSKIHIFNHYDKVRIYGRLLTVSVKKPLLKLQGLFHYNRIAGLPYTIKKGSDWFSITEDLAEYLVAHRRIIKRLFQYALVPTEFYVQTMIWNSPFRDKVYDIHNEFHSSIRHIDWTRGGPYTYRGTDFEELIQSESLFARKFDENVDFEIVEKIYDYLQAQQLPYL